MDFKINKKNSGFTLLETLIAVALFLIIGGGVYFAYSNILGVITSSRLNNEIISTIEGELESIRNMAYEDVGVQGGAPAGQIAPNKSVNSGALIVNLTTTVRNIDDPFDGTAGGVPNDTAPADYKLVEIEASCENCGIPLAPIKISATVAPGGLETETNNGSLFINALDASGQPVVGANVSVTNNQVTPPISINDVTNNNGTLQLVDIATSSNAYEISVSKSGYSSEQTHPLGAPENPNPTKPHSTVAEQAVTEISFAIDKVSVINLKSRDNLCSPVGNIDFLMEGSKIIGSGPPDVLKYSENLSTDTSGIFSNTSLEWDTYTLANRDTAYDLGGTSRPNPLVIDPDTAHDINWSMKPVNPRALLVSVKNSNNQFIDDADITLSKTGFSSTLISGRSSVSYSDWSGGQYDSKSSNIETDALPGKITLVNLGGKYASNSLEWLVSKTIDFGTPNITYYQVKWFPGNQPPETGIDSLKFQIATNNDGLTWNFIGPDGTVNSFYTLSDASLHSSHNNNRYFRYKAHLYTVDEGFAPSLEEIVFDFSSDCVPQGQAFFNGLTQGTHNIEINKAGYQVFTDIISIDNNWQSYDATLIPQ